jgi:hypothetical protein
VKLEEMNSHGLHEIGQQCNRVVRGSPGCLPSQCVPHAIYYADLSPLSEMKRVAAEIAGAEPHIDVLINNAGALFGSRQLTEYGLERTFALNHVAYFVLTLGLRERLVASTPARIVNTASDAGQCQDAAPTNRFSIERFESSPPRSKQSLDTGGKTTFGHLSGVIQYESQVALVLGRFQSLKFWDCRQNIGKRIVQQRFGILVVRLPACVDNLSPGHPRMQKGEPKHCQHNWLYARVETTRSPLGERVGRDGAFTSRRGSGLGPGRSRRTTCFGPQAGEGVLALYFHGGEGPGSAWKKTQEFPSLARNDWPGVLQHPASVHSTASTFNASTHAKTAILWRRR